MRFNERNFCWLAFAGAGLQRARRTAHDTAQEGQAVYQRTCAMCHDHGEALARPRSRPSRGCATSRLLRLTVGKMQVRTGPVGN